MDNQYRPFLVRRMSILAVILLCFLVVSSRAQKLPAYLLDPSKNINQYNIDIWESKDGLPSNSLLHLCQTKDGYLWITGYNGLVRFDGQRFVVFNKKSVSSFQTNAVSGLCEGADSTLWITTQGGGFISYKNGVFNQISDSLGIHNMYRGVFVDSKNRVWASSNELGWFYYDGKRINNLQFDSISLKNVEVRAIVEGGDGTVWFGTLGEGLFKYQDGKLANISNEFKFNTHWVYSLCVLDNQKILVGTGEGVFIYDGVRFSPFLNEIKSTVTRIRYDDFGNYWFATGDGLYRWKPLSQTVEHLTMEHGLPDNFIVDMVFDLEGSLWMTHYKGGLSRLKDGKFTNYNSHNGLPSKVVNTICEISEGEYIIGFDNGTVLKFDGTSYFPYKLNEKHGDLRVRHIFKDKQGNLWFSTYSGLLKRTPTGHDTWLNEEAGFVTSRIRCSFEDSRGNLWVGTRNDGVIRMAPDGKITSFTEKNGLSGNLIMSINEDRVGNIILCTSGGDGCFSLISTRDQVVSFGSNEGMRSFVGFNAYADADGVIWIATRNGLHRFKDGKIKAINIQEGLPEDAVFDVVEDALGNFWLPTNKGVIKLSKNELNQYFESQRSDFTVVVLDQFDGMMHDECNPSSQVLIDKKGKLFFPTLDGFAVIDPAGTKINNFIPPVKIEEIIVDGNTILPNKTRLKLKANTRRVTFKYTALSLYEPVRVRFKYRLEGFDKEWTTVENVRSVSYTNLPYGDYTFKVLACNNDEVWNETGDSIDLKVKPHFTDTWYFNSLVLIFIIVLVSGVIVWRTRHFEQKKYELESIIQVRTSELIEKTEILEKSSLEISLKNKQLEESYAEIEAQTVELSVQKEELKLLNNFKDQIFRIIAHDLRAPLGNMSNMLDFMSKHWKNKRSDDEIQSWLSRLNNLSRSTFGLLDNLMGWSLSHQRLALFNPALVNVATLLREVIQFVEPLAVQKEINLIVPSLSEIEIIADENMLKTVFRNLISNAIKFTRQGGIVSVDVLYFEKGITFSVVDNGIGMTLDLIDRILTHDEMKSIRGTSSEQGSGLGLIITKEFLQKHSSRLEIESTLGEGSKFFFTLSNEIGQITDFTI